MPHPRGHLVTLRPILHADLVLLHRWLNDPAVMQYWDGRDHPATFDRVEVRFRKSVEGVDREAFRFMIDVLDPNAPEGAGTRTIGMVQHGRIHARAKHAQVDLLIGDPEFRDAGFGTDAMRTVTRYLFEDLRLHRVWLTLRAPNVAAMRGAEKCGFKREGVLREHDYLEGKHVDVVIYGLLADEWKAIASSG